METIITYDISGKHSEFKNEMNKLGYKDRIKGIKMLLSKEDLKEMTGYIL